MIGDNDNENDANNNVGHADDKDGRDDRMMPIMMIAMYSRKQKMLLMLMVMNSVCGAAY